jgi:hypothetical protein
MGTTADDVESLVQEISRLIRDDAATCLTTEPVDAFVRAVADLVDNRDIAALRLASARAESLRRLVRAALPADQELRGRLLGQLDSVDAFARPVVRRESILVETRQDNEVAEALADRVLLLLKRDGPSRTALLADRLGVTAPQVSRALRLLIEMDRVCPIDAPTSDRRHRWYSAAAATTKAKRQKSSPTRPAAKKAPTAASAGN